MIDEYASHQLRGDAEEVRAILPLHVSLVHQPNVSLVNQRRRLQRVTRLFASQVARSLSTEFVVDDRHQLVERLFVAALVADKQLRDIRL